MLPFLVSRCSFLKHGHTSPLVPKRVLKSRWIMSSIDQGWMGTEVKDWNVSCLLAPPLQVCHLFGGGSKRPEVIVLPNPGNRHPLGKKVVQSSNHFLSKIVCRDITEDLKVALILLFYRWKVFMQIRKNPEQRNTFWSGLGKQLKKLRGNILWLQNSSTPLLVSYFDYFD